MTTWKLDKSSAHKQWDKLTPDDRDRACGSKAELVAFVQERYDISNETAPLNQSKSTPSGGSGTGHTHTSLENKPTSKLAIGTLF